jgi:hypothetical protein
MKLPETDKIKEFANKNGVLLFTIAAGLVFGGLSYYFLLSADAVHVSVESFAEELIKNQDDGANMLPNITLGLQVLNVVLAFALTLFSFSLFSSGLSRLFYINLAKKYGYEETDRRQTLRKTIEWQVYRYFMAFLPLIGYAAVAGVLSLLAVLLFSPLMAIVGLSAGVVAILASFVGLNMMLFFALAVLLTLWNFTGMIFGTEIVVSEPELEKKTIARRSERIVYTRENFLLFLVYSAFILVIATEIVRMHDNIPGFWAFLMMFSTNTMAYVGIKYLKTSAYIRSLLRYYEQVKGFAN